MAITAFSDIGITQVKFSTDGKSIVLPINGKIYPFSDGTPLSITKADGTTPVISFDTGNMNIGVNKEYGLARLHIYEDGGGFGTSVLLIEDERNGDYAAIHFKDNKYSDFPAVSVLPDNTYGSISRYGPCSGEGGLQITGTNGAAFPGILLYAQGGEDGYGDGSITMNCLGSDSAAIPVDEYLTTIHNNWDFKFGVLGDGSIVLGTVGGNIWKIEPGTNLTFYKNELNTWVEKFKVTP